MARIYIRKGEKGKVYYVDYAVSGRRVRKKIGTQKRLAEFALADVTSKITRQELGLPSIKKSLDDFIEEYLAWAEKEKPSSHQKKYSSKSVFVNR